MQKNVIMYVLAWILVTVMSPMAIAVPTVGDMAVKRLQELDSSLNWDNLLRRVGGSLAIRAKMDEESPRPRLKALYRRQLIAIRDLLLASTNIERNAVAASFDEHYLMVHAIKVDYVVNRIDEVLKRLRDFISETPELPLAEKLYKGVYTVLVDVAQVTLEEGLGEVKKMSRSARLSYQMSKNSPIPRFSHKMPR